MQFRTSILTAIVSLAALTSAMPTPKASADLAKRIPCIEATDKPASADYKRDTAAQGDDTAGLIVACNF